ncbi:MAG TPA: hypothetical protein VNN08_07425 [Thermoanaerobaculia bacterium]|nr:hypothetical protein [Thermoanaerobaculia bacterium]
MKNALLLLLLLTGCASGAQDDPNAPNITFHLNQYETATNAYTYNGALNLTFALSMTNTTNQPVKVSRIEIRTIGSGAFTIRSTSTPINTDLGPGESKTMPLSLWGYARGGQLSSTEPVTIRGTAYLTGPSGSFLRLFSEYITPQ